MKKSFKKAIAVLLAVLMVAFSMPLSALAAIGDYTPDLDVMFGTFHDLAATSWTDYADGSKDGDLSGCGLYDVPVDFDYKLVNGLTKSGTLYIDKDKANTANTSIDLGYDTLTENITLGVGDYFTCTFVAKNIENVGALMAAFEYSDNLEPAGLYSVKSGRNTLYYCGTEEDRAAANGTWSEGGPSAIQSMSSGGLYKNINNGPIGDVSSFKTTAGGRNYFLIQQSVQDGSGTENVSKVTNEYFANPNTGSLSGGYTYDCYILETIVFKIVAEGDVAITLLDPDNSEIGGYQGASMVAAEAEGTTLDKMTTYAYNDSYTGHENPGSRKMTCFGVNVNVESTECTHSNTEVRGAVEATCTTNGYTGDTWCLDCGEKIATGETIPATNHSYEITADTTSSCTVAGKTTYTCSKCGDTYDVTKDLADHTPVTIPAVAPTCTTDGSTEGTKCSVCGEILVAPQVDPATGHSPALDQSTVKAATCTEAGYTGDTKCTVCGALITAGQATDPTGHDWSVWTSNNDGTHSRVCANDSSHTESADCSYSYEVVTPATEVAEGTGRYTCTVCDYSYDVTIPKTDCSHATTEVRNAVEATCTEDGYTGDTYCTVCGAQIATGKVINATGHNYEITADTDSTCKVAGVTTYTCTKCGDAYDVTKDLADHTPETIPAVAPTCTEDGTTEGSKCSVCGEILVAPQVDPATGHSPALDPSTVKAATCTDPGYTGDTKCTVCGAVITAGQVIPATGHQHTEVRDAKEATITSEGYTGDTWCLDCGEKIATGETIAKLPSVQVTVEATDLAEQVALDEWDVTDGATIAYAVNADITLSAKPLEGAEFLGWAVNGNIVSSENPYSTKAISTVTYVPVFTETAADTFTVVFIDNYGNVISTQTVASAAEITAPTAPARPGYTFAGWSVDYTALTEGATVVAKYTKDAAALYTVTATGCTITTAAGERATDVMTDVPYDTKVTITNNGDAASSWTIGGATVAFGESYTFYVGSDVEVTPAFDAAVKAVPTVSAVSVDELVDASTGRTKAVFLATRSMTSDCKLIANGFIYGKNLADTAITLEDVDGSTVKRVQNSSNAAQFSLTYSLKAQTGTMVARAYLTYENADGEIVTIYAEPQTYTYA
ncbi:MAG: InlB B-repeat-containing protein [Eubacteriales bacterium]|nr:InlB B-repeat-containing protein [Eubacteriales bacterium]